MGIKRDYIDDYADKVGTIEGEDDMRPVTIGPVALSTFCVPERAAQFGCPEGELALLVQWLPAGLIPGPTDAENRIDLAQIPDMTEWVVFPKRFQDIPVYYKRGGVIRARSPR